MSKQEVAHTPGPWSAFTDYSGSKPHTNIVAVVPHTDCVFSLPGMHKNDPNVRLLAAAPDLLEVAEDSIDILTVAIDLWNSVYPEEPDEILTDLQARLRAAIAKATGK